MYIYIYKITNNINQKEYIGVHTSTVPDDSYFGSGSAIKAAIKKYSKENFSKIILEYFDNIEHAYSKEAELVNSDYVNRNDTYNQTPGGKIPPNRKGVTLTEETKFKLAKYRSSENGKTSSAKGGKNLWKIKSSWDQESIRKRVNTRKKEQTYLTDMSACHTLDAIIKRTDTRKNKGNSYNTTTCNNIENRFKRERTKLIKTINNISSYYDLPFSLKLLKRARKEKVTYLLDKSLLKYFTNEEILQLSCDELLTK